MQIWRRGLHAAGAVAGLLAFCASTVSAAPISGTVNISGSVAVGGTFIDFQPPVGPPNGLFAVSNSGNTGNFGTLNNTGGSILDLNEMVQTPGSGGFTPLTGFITFTAGPTIRLDLTEIDPGNLSTAACGMPPAAGQVCTPAAFPGGVPNPFDLVNSSATTSSATITFRGNAVNTATGETDTFVGVFTTQFTVPYQTLLTTISGGGTVSTSYSATITVTPSSSTVPEPASFVLFGLGLIGLSVVGSRRYR